MYAKYYFTYVKKKQKNTTVKSPQKGTNCEGKVKHQVNA